MGNNSPSFLKIAKPYKAIIENSLATWLERSVAAESRPLVSEALCPGRRLRPVLMLMLIAPIEEVESILERHPDLESTWLSLELLHRSSIIVDDMIDLDVERRSRPTFHLRHSEEHTVLVSHYLVSEAVRLFSTLGIDTRNAFADAYREMCIGELVDVCGSGEFRPAWETYKSIVLRKTNKLFASLFTIAAKFVSYDNANFDPERLGRKVGNLYQMANDFYDGTQPLDARGDKVFFKLTFDMLTALAIDANEGIKDEATKLIGRKLNSQQFSSWKELIHTPEMLEAAQTKLSLAVKAVEAELEFVPSRWGCLLGSFCDELLSPDYWNHREFAGAGY
jgi:geranylgeranyl pyrophosphate synthase